MTTNINRMLIIMTDKDNSIFIYIDILKVDSCKVKILKCESFLIALSRNSTKWAFLLRRILKSRLCVEILKG